MKTRAGFCFTRILEPEFIFVHLEKGSKDHLEIPNLLCKLGHKTRQRIRFSSISEAKSLSGMQFSSIWHDECIVEPWAIDYYWSMLKITCCRVPKSGAEQVFTSKSAFILVYIEVDQLDFYFVISWSDQSTWKIDGSKKCTC